MMRYLSLCLLGLVVPSIAEWQPVGRGEFEEALQENDYTLVACKFKCEIYSTPVDGVLTVQQLLQRRVS